MSDYVPMFPVEDPVPACGLCGVGKPWPVPVLDVIVQLCACCLRAELERVVNGWPLYLKREWVASLADRRRVLAGPENPGWDPLC